jgi:glycosyltransferase involved in cell wall biosynthesis
MRLGIQQRLLPEYRVSFFDCLASRVKELQVFAGSPLETEAIRSAKSLDHARWVRAKNLHLGSSANYLCWQANCSRWLRDFGPEILVTEANPRLTSNYSAISYARQMGIPVIGWGLGVLYRKPGQQDSERRSRNYFFKLFLRQFDAMISYSSKGAEDYISLGCDPLRVFVAPNAVAGGRLSHRTEELPVDAKALASWRRERNLTGGPVLLFVGRLIPEKRLPLLLEACARLGDKVQLVIVGEGPERGRLEQIAANIFPRAHFLGHLTGDALTACFSATDLFVLPGSGGLSMQEAMAYGQPVVVASGDGSQWDLVEDGVTGFHLTASEPDALYQVLSKALTNLTRLRAMGQAAREKIQSTHNLDSMVNAFVAALQSVKNLGPRARLL